MSKPQLDKLHQRAVQSTNVADAVRIARFFGKTVEEFIGEPPDMAVASLMSKIEELSESERRFLEAQLDVLAANRQKDLDL